MIELVMVDALNDEEAGAGVLVDCDEFGGVELGGIPVAQDFLVARLGGMAVIADVVVIGAVAFDIQATCIPVAALAGGLRAEVNPDAELGVAQPGGGAGIVFLNGFPSRRVGAGGDGKVEFHFRRGPGVGHLHAVHGLGGGYGGEGRQRRQGGADGVGCGHEGCQQGGGGEEGGDTHGEKGERVENG